MWVDWVKFFDLADIDETPDYDYTCKANPDSSIDDLCGSAQWACYDQNYAFMGDVCDEAWRNCCHRRACTQEETVEECSRVFEQYDSQIHDGNSCDFNGHAIKDWGEAAPTQEPTSKPPNNGDKEVCRADPNASNANLCGSMEWACYGHSYVDMKAVCDRRVTWGCCWDGGTQCSKQDLLNDGDMVFDYYYQAMSPNGADTTHCDFNGAGYLEYPN